MSMSLARLPESVLLQHLLPHMSQSSLSTFSRTNKYHYDLCWKKFSWEKVNVDLSTKNDFVGFAHFLRQTDYRSIRSVDITMNVRSYGVGLLVVPMVSVKKFSLTIDVVSNEFDARHLLADVFIMAPNVKKFSLSVPVYCALKNSVLPTAPWNLDSLDLDIDENEFDHNLFNCLLSNTTGLEKFSFSACDFPDAAEFFASYSQTLQDVKVLQESFDYWPYFQNCPSITKLTIAEDLYISRPSSDELPPNLTELTFISSGMDNFRDPMIAPTVRKFTFVVRRIASAVAIRPRQNLFQDIAEMFPKVQEITMAYDPDIPCYDVDVQHLGGLQDLEKLTFRQATGLTGGFLAEKTKTTFKRLKYVEFQKCKQVLHGVCGLGVSQRRIVRVRICGVRAGGGRFIQDLIPYPARN